MRTVALTALALSMAAMAMAQEAKEPAGEPVVRLADVPANTWARIAYSPTGGREQPVFLYAASIKRFILATGMQATGGTVPRHYDTEEFDLAAAKWFNAYPPGLAATRPESGPLGDDYSAARAAMGRSGAELFYKDGEFLRLAAGGQWVKTRLDFEHCYVPDNGKVYVYTHDKTLCYDPAKRTWEDLNAKPRTSGRLWGSMCYDPVNKEIVHAGGDGGSADIGTWVYSIEANEWRKLDFAASPLSKPHAAAKELRWQAKALLGAIVNRFTVAETEAEAKADLKAKASELAAAAAKFSAEVSTKSAMTDESAAQAAGRLDAAEKMLKGLAPKLAGPITPEIIAEARAARVLFEQAADALAVEPPGRARSQIAYDPEHKKIVLFGGDHLDRVLADTWVYDCATRTWQQKFPKQCPLPRAGHVLAWLPKAKKIVLAGGYSREPLAQQVWTYDLAANEWKMLLHVPLAGGGPGRPRFSPDCPRVTARSVQNGAVNEDDVLVCITAARPELTTWACKIDAAKPIEIPEGQAGTSGQYTFNRIDPADWEKVASPDAEKTKKLYADLPANQWTALKFARYAPGARNRWGTTAYDPQRHQLLFWGGGHATSQENDVAHFSLRGNCWTLGYHPDDPIEIVYASQPTPVSFEDRVHVPVHAYKAYCYDPTAGKMFYFGHSYDPAVREWEPKVYPGLSHRGPMHSHMEPTPAGAVTYSDRGLFRFDAKAAEWVKLPWDGPNAGGIWCDGDSLLYDSKRNCLWLAKRTDLFRYDLASGKAEKVALAKPKALGEFIFWGEEVYLPQADLVLLMRLFSKPDGGVGNVAWDPTDGKFYWVDLGFVEDGKDVAMKAPGFTWHDALHYDAALNLIVLNNSAAQKVWVLRFDRKSAKMEELKD